MCLWCIFQWVNWSVISVFKQIISWCIFSIFLSDAFQIVFNSSWIFWKNILSCDYQKLVLHIEERICTCKLPLYWKKWLDQTWVSLFLISWVDCPRMLCMWMVQQSRTTKSSPVRENYVLFSRELTGLQIWIQLEEHNLQHPNMFCCLNFFGSISIINVRYHSLFPILVR